MQTIVGMFTSQQDAQDAINRLDELGVEEDTIHVLTRGGIQRQADTLIGVLGRAFTAGDTELEAELIRLGLDQEEAEFYDQELDPEGVILAVEVDEDRDPAVRHAFREANGVLRS